MSETTPPDYEAVHRAATTGTRGRPDLMIVTGDVLNARLGTDAYDPTQVYHVTPHGITCVDVPPETP